MAKSKNGATEPGNSENPKNPKDAITNHAAVGAPLDAPAPQPPGQSSARKSKEPSKKVPGRPRKQSRQGKGGGPKTAAGRAKVSRNATKHGIHAIHPVVIADFESVEEWDDFYEGFRESLVPEGAVEEDIVYNLASNRWRQRRIIHAETAAINEQVWKTAENLGLSDAYANSITKEYELDQMPDPDPLRVLLRQQTRIIPDAPRLELLVRYEGHLHRVCSQLHIQLEVLQARRQGKPTPFHRVDITSPPQFRNSTRRPQISDVLPDVK